MAGVHSLIGLVCSIGEYDVNWLPDEIRQFVSPLTNRMYITHENVTQEHYLKATIPHNYNIQWHHFVFSPAVY